MFDIGWTELVVIGVVALIAIGPKELPGALRALGQWMGKIRRMASEFQGQFQEAMREAEMADLKKQVDTLTSSFDPIETARKEIEGAMEDRPTSPATSDAATAEAAAWSDTAADTAGYGPPAETQAAAAPVSVAEQPADAAPAPADAAPQAAGGRAA
jgi:sec-independent protein translocase protein TatB